jgi:hypothetical protein
MDTLDAELDDLEGRVATAEVRLDEPHNIFPTPGVFFGDSTTAYDSKVEAGTWEGSTSKGGTGRLVVKPVAGTSLDVEGAPVVLKDAGRAVQVAAGSVTQTFDLTFTHDISPYNVVPITMTLTRWGNVVSVQFNMNMNLFGGTGTGQPATPTAPETSIVIPFTMPEIFGDTAARELPYIEVYGRRWRGGANAGDFRAIINTVAGNTDGIQAVVGTTTGGLHARPLDVCGTYVLQNPSNFV